MLLFLRTGVLFLSLLGAVTPFFVPPELVESGEWEPLNEYRERMGIEYEFRPQFLPNPEHCRHLSEVECRNEDEAAMKRLDDALVTGRSMSESFGQNVKALVLLVQFTDHLNRTLPPRGENAPQSVVFLDTRSSLVRSSCS